MEKSQKKVRKFIAILLSSAILPTSYLIYESKWGGRRQETSQETGKPQRVFREAPNFDLPDASGQKQSLSEFRGKLVILHFWASWCTPCLEEIPRWLELAEYFKNRQIQLVAISLDSSWEDVHKVLPTDSLKGSSGKVVSLLDLSGKLPDEYGTYQYPETYLISPDQKILFKWVGPQSWTAPETRQVIEKVLDSMPGHS